MASSILRGIYRRGASHYNTVHCVSAGILRSANSRCGCKAAPISTLSVSDESILRPPPSTLPSRVSPWLMLPPAVEGGGGGMVYNFYSLAENKVISYNNRAAGGGGGESELPDNDAMLLGSSHGWLALFNRRNNRLFLSNPLTRRHIKLPPLPGRETYLKHGGVFVKKVIISSSPDDNEEECRAMIIFGLRAALAFCCPGRSSVWTPIGDDLFKDDTGKTRARQFQDFVYSSRHCLFFCVTQVDDELECWDFRDPSSPRICWKVELEELEFDEENYPWTARSEEELKLKLSTLCRQVRYLVFAEELNQLFLVTRHVVEQMGPDGCSVKSIYYGLREGFDDSYPYKTIGFDVHAIDREDGRLRYMEGSLDGLAVFVGINHSFAISAAEFPELKSNSIYFTDDKEFTPPDNDGGDSIYGGHDIGIFDYENGTFSDCYYPCDVQSIKRIVPAPLWFTPPRLH